jgi:hypothetical protein
MGQEPIEQGVRTDKGRPLRLDPQGSMRVYSDPDPCGTRIAPKRVFQSVLTHIKRGLVNH